MAAKKVDVSTQCQSICDDIKSGSFAPVYLLHGEESYFIDRISNCILDNVLTEEERDFNLIQFFGADVVNVGDIVSACRRYPMMSERQLVMFCEMQAFDNRHQKLDDLILYISHPLESTILVLMCKTKTLGAKLVKAVKDIGGVVFESEKIRDYKLPEIVKPYIEERGLSIDNNALTLLCNSIGSDLNRMFHELDKIKLNIHGNRITSEIVASQVGVSKDFNVWELQSAIAVKDFLKVDMIRRYFAANPKASPLVLTLFALFSFFSNLMLAYYSSDKSEKGLMSELKVSYPAAKDLVIAMRNYNAWKTMNIISLIREYDAKSKGARNVSLSDNESLQELLFQIMH